MYWWIFIVVAFVLTAVAFVVFVQNKEHLSEPQFVTLNLLISVIIICFLGGFAYLEDYKYSQMIKQKSQESRIEMDEYMENLMQDNIAVKSGNTDK